MAPPKILDKFPEQSYTYRVITWAYSSVGRASVSLLCPTELWAFKWGVCRLVAQPCHAPKYGPIAQLGERSVRIREVKGSNPSRSTFSSSVILTLLLFFCIHISHTLALGPRGIRTARPCRRQGKQSAQCNGDDRSQWLKQGGAVGAAFGFFKALPRGCGKISQRNPSLLLRARVPTSRNVYRGDFRFCRIVLYDAAFFCLKNFGRPCRVPSPEVGCEPGGGINVETP